MYKHAITTKKYQVIDISLNVAEVGQGKPLIFIHGWSNNWNGWTLLAQELATDYKCYLIDLPGFGDSDPLPSYTLEKVADYVGTFIKKYVPQSLALIGGSGGTFVVAQIVTQFNLNTRLILIGTIFKKKRIQWIADVYQKILKFSAHSIYAQRFFEKLIKHRYCAYFAEKYLNAFSFNKHLVDTYQVPGRQKITGKSYVQLGLGYMGFFMDEFLQTTTLPVLLIFGKGDRYVRPETARKMVHQFKKETLQLEFIDRAGHSPAYEQPKLTANVILKYLRNH